MFIFDALMESIMCGNNSINGPVNIAKERLDKLVKVNPATQLSGYEVQFKVNINCLPVWSLTCIYVLNF